MNNIFYPSPKAGHLMDEISARLIYLFTDLIPQHAFSSVTRAYRTLSLSLQAFRRQSMPRLAARLYHLNVDYTIAVFLVTTVLYLTILFPVTFFLFR